MVIVPILRAGLGMVEGLQELMPSTFVGHLGMYRDPETHEPHEYYAKLPDSIAQRDVLVVDPMLATGGSATAAIHYLREQGVKNIKLDRARGGARRASRPSSPPTPTCRSTPAPSTSA